LLILFGPPDVPVFGLGLRIFSKFHQTVFLRYYKAKIIRSAISAFHQQAEYFIMRMVDNKV
jgi:hypothetical protein